MVDRWQELTGPAQWFRLEIPADWTFSHCEDAVRVYAADGRVRLTVYSFWHSARNVTAAQLLDPQTLFPGAFGLRKLAPLQIPQASCGLDGYSAAAAESPLIERVLTPKRKTGWQVWSIRHNEVCVICAVEPTAESTLSTRQKRVARSILERIRFAEPPCAPPSEFGRRLVNYTRQHFRDPPRLIGNLHLAIGDARISLTNFYRAYLRDPGSLREIQETLIGTVEQLLDWENCDIDPDFESVRDRIMPMLTPASVWRESLSEFVSEPWIAGLRIMYVVDEQDAYWYIRESQATGWGLDATQLHDLSLRNLSEYFERRSNEMTAVDDPDGLGPRLLMPANADAYNSVRLLAQPFHRRLQRLLGPQFAIGIPNRDFFVAVSLKNTEMLDRVRGRVAADYKTMDHPLTDRILIVSTDGVSEYCEQG